MKIKEETVMGIMECFESLQDKGYNVTLPKLDIDTRQAYALGCALPIGFSTQITATIVITLTEDDIILENKVSLLERKDA